MEVKPRRRSNQPELSAIEPEIDEITKDLERDRRDPGRFGKILKTPLQGADRKSRQYTHCLHTSSPHHLHRWIFLDDTTYGIQVLFKATTIDDFPVLAVLVAIVPVAILNFRDRPRVKNLENALPNFFRDLAGMNDSGMTLPNAVHIVAGAEYSTLTPPYQELDQDMSWGAGFVEAMNRFGKDLGTPLADRSVDLIAKASKAGGDISEVLRAAAKDTFEVVNLAQERSNNMLIYVIIVLVSFAVFLFVIAILVSTFLTTMATAGASASAAGARGFMGMVDLFLYKRLFTHAALLQGFSSGPLPARWVKDDLLQV